MVIRWCLFEPEVVSIPPSWLLFRQSGYHFANLVTIYEAGSCFLNLVYGWCMAGVWLVYIHAELVYISPK